MLDKISSSTSTVTAESLSVLLFTEIGLLAFIPVGLEPCRAEISMLPTLLPSSLPLCLWEELLWQH